MQTSPSLDDLPSELLRKQARIEERLASLGSAVVAFSGGVDSALLVALAHRALGNRCLVMTAVSPSLPARELDSAKSFTKALGVEHRLVETAELSREGFVENSGKRCFYCKSELFDHCFALAQSEGYAHVLYGATVDDLGDHRPGMRAAKEQGALAPLLEGGMTKAEIRELSRALGLPTWNKPAMACLSSRFPYGTRVTSEGLSQVERAEDVLYALGFREYRVRFHGEVARIELGAKEWSRIHEDGMRSHISSALQKIGFRYVSLDLDAFVSGSLNRTLETKG